MGQRFNGHPAGTHRACLTLTGRPERDEMESATDTNTSTASNHRTVYVAVAFLLAFTAAVGLPELLSQLHGATIDRMVHESPVDKRDADTFNAAQLPDAVVLNLKFSPGKLEGSYSFSLEPDSPLVARLEAGQTGVEVNRFVGRFLGTIIVRDGRSLFDYPNDISGNALTFGTPEITRSGASHAYVLVPIDTATVGDVSQIYVGPPEGPTATAPPTDTARSDRRAPSSVSIEAGETGRVSARYNDSPNSELPHAGIFIRPVTSTTPLMFEIETNISNAPTPATAHVVSNLGFVLSLPLLSLVYGALESLPLLILLVVLKPEATEDGRPARFGQFQPLARYVVSLAVTFIAAVRGTDAAVQAVYNTRGLLSDTKPYSYINPSYAGALGLLVVFAVFLWPTMVRRMPRSGRATPIANQSSPQRLAHPLRSSIAVVAGAGLAGITWLLHLPPSIVDIALASGLVIALAVIMEIVVGRAPGRRGAALNALAVLAAVAILSASSIGFPVLLQDGTGWPRLIMVATLIVFAIAAVGAFAWLLGRLALEVRPPQPVPDAAAGADGLTPGGATPQRRWLVALAPAAALAILVSHSFWNVARERTGTPLNPFSLLDLAFGLDYLVYFPAAVCLLILLRQASTERHDKIDSAALRHLGIALLLVLVFSHWSRWFYLPLPFLLSWLVAATVVLPKDPVTTPSAHPPEHAHLRTLLDAQIVGYRLRSIRQKYRSGDDHVTEFEYDTQVKVLEGEKARLHLAANHYGDPYLVPPADTRWESGKRGLAYGFIFSIPSMAVYLYQRFTLPAPTDPYPLLRIIGAEPFLPLQWTIYGFFLGYFFTMIRGRTGIDKATWFFLALLTHNTFVTLLTPNANWTSHLLWALQTFIQLVLVGILVGDYQIAKRAGLGWRDLIDIHDARWVAAFGTTIAAAVGGVTLTIFTTGLTDLYKNATHNTPAATPAVTTPATTPDAATTSTVAKR